MFDTLVLLPLVMVLQNWFIFLPAYFLITWFLSKEQSFGKQVLLALIVAFSLWGVAMMIGVVKVSNSASPPRATWNTDSE